MNEISGIEEELQIPVGEKCQLLEVASNSVFLSLEKKEDFEMIMGIISINQLIIVIIIIIINKRI